MTAISRWQERVGACRKAREKEDQCWQRLANWYDNWTRHNDYVELILPRLLQHIEPATQILEIGPGSGAFTLPLASAALEVVAVEPSPFMRSVLTRKLSDTGITNVNLVSQRIEDGLEMISGPFELALASHSIYNIMPIDTVVRKLVQLAPHVYFLIGTGEQRGWVSLLYRRFKGRDRDAFPQLRHFYPVLLEMGIYADVEIIWTSANYVCDSEEALVEWWRRQLHIDGEHREMLRDALLRIAERRGKHVGIYDRHRTALVWIDRERSVSNWDDRGDVKL